MRTGLARRGAAGRGLAAVACAVLCASLKTERALFFELLQMDAEIESHRFWSIRSEVITARCNAVIELTFS